MPHGTRQKTKVLVWFTRGRVMMDSWVPSGSLHCLSPGWFGPFSSLHRICGSWSSLLQFGLMVQEAMTGSPRRTMGTESLMCPQLSGPRLIEGGSWMTPLPGQHGPCQDLCTPSLRDPPSIFSPSHLEGTGTKREEVSTMYDAYKMHCRVS